MFKIVFCTCPDADTAHTLATQLIKKRLAACVNISSEIISIFRWENRIENTKESLLMIKTTDENYNALAEFIAAQHPYAVPEIIALPITHGWPPYLAWLKQNCQQEEI